MNTVLFSRGRLLAVLELTGSVVAVSVDIAAVDAVVSVANGCSYWSSFGDTSDIN